MGLIVENSAVLDLPAPTAHACAYRPPRLGDLLHARLGDGPEHSAMLESVGDDGHTLIMSGPVGQRELVITIRRVGALHSQDAAHG